MKQHIINLIKFAVVVAIGLAIFKLMTGNAKVAEHLPDSLSAKIVRTVAVKQQPFVAAVRAYGNIEPAIKFSSRSELSAKVSYIHPELEEGGSIKAGTVVIRLDSQDFEISLSQTQSDLSSSESALDRLKQEQRNTRLSLDLARENLVLGEAEFGRVNSLLEKQLVARSALDAEEQKVIQLRQAVSDLEGKLRTYASQLASAGAQIDRSSQQVKSQRTTLGRTEITMPFDARISSVSVSENEFVSVGASLFEAINTDGVEVRADLPIRTMRDLLSAFNGQKLDFDGSNIAAVVSSLNLKAEVRLVEAGADAVWVGRVVRFAESIDPQRRTIGLTVAVDNPYSGVVIGSKPPLIRGMYVAIDLSAPAYPAISLPRTAVHQNRVYLVADDNTLQIRPVKIRAKQGNSVVISDGLNVGERVIIDDLIPVIPGMPLQAVDADVIDRGQ